VKLAALRFEGQPRVARVEPDGFHLFPAELASGWPEPLADSGALSALPTDVVVAREEVQELLPPVWAPQKIFCVGSNYEAHRIEMGREVPQRPLVFMRTAMTLRGHGQPLWLPSESERLDYEGEVAVVIGRPGRRIARADAWSHVAALSAFDDASVRDWQRHSSQFTAGKNFDATGGFGPWLVTPDEVEDLDAVTLETRVNGELRQTGVLSDLTFSVPALIAYISSFATLVPGDVVVTGTPSGVGHAQTPPRYLQAGDEVEVRVGGVGSLRNRVIDDPLG
jgi:2-keto-4-pentenoate hydratase/2-oxohepta-3-ene-1,7-dioic acid hydratase in catechol pathway